MPTYLLSMCPVRTAEQIPVNVSMNIRLFENAFQNSSIALEFKSQWHFDYLFK